MPSKKLKFVLLCSFVCLLVLKQVASILSSNKRIQPIPVASRSKAWICVRTFAGDCRLGTRQGHGCLSLADVVWYQAEFSAMDRSLVQGSSAEYICH